MAADNSELIKNDHYYQLIIRVDSLKERPIKEKSTIQKGLQLLEK